MSHDHACCGCHDHEFAEVIEKAFDLLFEAKEYLETDGAFDTVGSDVWLWKHKVDALLPRAKEAGTPRKIIPAFLHANDL